MKHALMLSGYHAISQKHWCDYVVQTCTDYQWTVVDLPPRYFSWRMRGNPLSILAKAGHIIEQEFDLIVATSTIDLSVVQSIFLNLRNVPSILYFHENQFSYPTENAPKAVVDLQMVNLYSAMRADQLIFNSQYNESSFMEGATKLLKKLPDLVPKNLVNSLKDKSQLLAVPIKNGLTVPTENSLAVPIETDLVPSNTTHKAEQELEQKPEKAIVVLWNHRWEWDKNPELLEAIISEVSNQKLNIRFVITGQQFRKIPQALQNITSQFSTFILHAGFIEDSSEYHALIQQADIVLSTAIHEFQGIAVMEAVQAGCIPLLPNRLSYPEFFNSEFLYEGNSQLNDQAKTVISRILNWQQNGFPTLPNLNKFTEDEMTEQYKSVIFD